jgi:2-oxoglutarate dehydrogenase E2 component (dihydrolipoamide succinyltransferase)
MIVDVIMPQMGESITEGTIIEWKIEVGQSITKDGTLLEISTDKVDSEIPSPATGVLKEILFESNSTVEVGAVIARLEATEDGAVEQKAEVEAPPPPSAPKPADAPVDKVVPQVEPEQPDLSPKYYSPLVRSIAREEGVTPQELAGIEGSGREGRVTKADLMAYLEKRGKAKPAEEVPAAKAAPTTAPPVHFAAPGGESLADEVLPMSRIRQRIAEHMRTSLDAAAHVYAVSECDMTPVVEARRSHNTAFHQSEGFKLTYTPMIAYATVKAIKDFPLINAQIDGTNIVKKRSINLGIAVALPDYSLIVPVIHGAEELNFVGLARKIVDLADRARGSKLKPEEAVGSTFTITNFGVFGSLFGLPIINQPNVAILGVGGIKKRPVVWESDMGDSIVIRSMSLMSISHDHRLIDGAYGTHFLQRIVEYLQTIDWDKEL